MSAILSALGKEAIKYGTKEIKSRALKKAASLTVSGLEKNQTLSEAKGIIEQKDDSFFTKRNLAKAAATIGLGVATGGSSLLVQLIVMSAVDVGIDQIFDKLEIKKPINSPQQITSFEQIDFTNKEEVNQDKKKRINKTLLA